MIFFFFSFFRSFFRSQTIERKGTDMCLLLSEVVRKQANALKYQILIKVCVSSLSRVRLFATPGTVAC